MRVLFFGDLAPTGFGSVTTDMGRELLKLGADVRFVSQNDTGDDLPEPFRSRTVDLVSLPYAVNELSGEAGTIGPADGIPAIVEGTSRARMHDGTPSKGWVPEAIIVLGDFYAARHIIGRFVDVFRKVPTFHYVPVEGVGLPPLWKELWSIASPVAMSEFGADQIAEVMGERPPVVYHGIDTQVFYPASKATPLAVKSAEGAAFLSDREECKRAWLQALCEVNHTNRVPRHWLLRTDRHMPRKRYDALLRTLGPVLERHPDWALIIHCNLIDQGGYIPDAVSKLPEQVQHQILFTEANGVDRSLLAVLYNAADLYVSNSAEGFGLTIAEAVACGIPAVGIDYSAVPEVIGPAGVTVPVAHLLDNEYAHSWAAADEAEYARVVEHLMTHKTKRQDLGRLGPAHVRTSFRWDTAARQFLDLIHASVSSEEAA